MEHLNKVNFIIVMIISIGIAGSIYLLLGWITRWVIMKITNEINEVTKSYIELKKEDGGLMNVVIKMYMILLVKYYVGFTILLLVVLIYIIKFFI
jgi:hypothetical protein